MIIINKVLGVIAVKLFLIRLISLILRFFLWFRYRITYKGLEIIDPKVLNKPAGTLFLPNHPTIFVDPLIVTLGIWQTIPIRPMIVENFYHYPLAHPILKMLNALPVPDFHVGSNSLKRKNSEQMIQTVIEDLKKGDSFLIYPSGRTKQTGIEVIGGASSVHRIIQEVPDANIVLVRVKGLWGSSFSRAFTGESPPLIRTLLVNLKNVFKNLILFSPRRDVIVEYHLAPADFPYKSTRMKMNKWLEDWYNQPDGLSIQQGDHPGDSLCLVSNSIWSRQIPELYDERGDENDNFSISTIDPEIISKVRAEIARITETPIEDIKFSMRLDQQLGMDSLDISDLCAFIQDNFDVKQVYVPDLTTVAKTIAIAAKKVKCRSSGQAEVEINFDKWNSLPLRKKVDMPPGNTMPEVFLNNCKRMGNAVACGDELAGILTYKELKLRIILLAEYVRSIPGKYIGILLPSSVAAYAVILACQLAGKVPLLINWAIGSRHIEGIKTLSHVETVLTSRAFLNRLENVDLDGIHDEIILLEDVRGSFTIKDKIKAYYRSILSTAQLLKIFNIDKVSKDDPAVLLFTSGTESLPKGVPLSHENVLSNQRQVAKSIDIYSDDIILGMLPPFHAFGFSLTGLMSLMIGIRAVYTPDPTDGIKVASIIKKWRVSVTCGAPTFIKNFFRAGTPDHFKSLRLCVTGAEKAPPELFKAAEELGVGDIILEGYGTTECSPVLTGNRLGKEHVGVGEPLEGVEIQIIHPETHQSLSRMQRGLIIAKGPNVFKGYLNPNVSSPYITIDGEQWYNTGDLGHLDDRNNLVISGRQKRFIKIGGEMLSLAAIEDALLQSAPNKKWPVNTQGPTLAICGKEIPGEKPKIVLFSTFDTTVEEVNLVLREMGFSNLVKVVSVIKLSEIPIMGTGKIFYRELENTYL